MLTLVLGTAAPASADEEYGGGDDQQSGSTSLTSGGEVVTETTVTENEDGSVTTTVTTSYRYPDGTTVIGKRQLQDQPDGTDPWDVCFTVSFHLTGIEDAERSTMLGEAAFQQQVADHEDAWQLGLQSHEALMDRYRAANEEAIEAGEEPPYTITAFPDPDLPAEACPGEDGIVPDFTPAFLATADHLDQLRLGVPAIEPGRGITGVEMYLQTGRPLSQPRPTEYFPDLGTDWSSGTPVPLGGTVRMTAEGTYTVDWGDGTVTGPHEDPGGPYPGTGPLGAVTHTYLTEADAYEVIVTDSWAVTVTVEFAGEVLTFWDREVMDPSPPLAFPVGEVRSVRND